MHYDCERTIQQQSDDVKDTSTVNTYGTGDNQIVNTEQATSLSLVNQQRVNIA